MQHSFKVFLTNENLDVFPFFCVFIPFLRFADGSRFCFSDKSLRFNSGLASIHGQSLSLFLNNLVNAYWLMPPKMYIDSSDHFLATTRSVAQLTHSASVPWEGGCRAWLYSLTRGAP